jgi:uncharacterized repeat protein (TIGR01451 family)
VTLSDTVGGVAVSGGPIASLAPGAVDTSTFTGSYTVTQADIDAGSFVNTATVTGTPPSGPDVSDPDDETVTLEQAPALSIEKTGDVGPIPLGDSIDYTITVTNSGNVTLHNVTVTDPLLGISQNVGTLAPQAFQVINGTYGPVTLNDLPGPVVNTATAVSDEAGPVDDDHSVEVYGNPELTIEKTGDAGPVRIGESINYMITVTNTGDVPLNNVTVTDPLLGISQNLGTLNPSDVRVINGTYGPVVERDRPGPIVNTATADSDETEPVDDEHSVPIYVPVPSLAIDKDGPGVAEIGDTIVYTITVTNNGDVDLTNVTLTDPFLGLTEFIGPLAIGQSVTFNPTYGPVTEADLPGPITNVATADSDETQPVQDSHLIHIDTPPVIDLSLTIGVNNPTPSIGEDVVFTVTLTNADGFATATGVNVKSLLPAGYDFVSADPEIGLYNGPTNTWAVGVVPPGVSVTLQITATVTDIDDYEVLAEVSAAGQQDVDSTPANASVLSEDDDDKVPVEPGPAGGGGGLACIGKVIINEIAWSGTAADATNEWIELRNLGSEPVDLTGWTLQWRKKNPVTVEDFTWSRVDLSGTINGAGLSACEIALQDPEPSVEFEKRAVDDVSWYVVSKPLEDHGGYYTLERLSDRTIANVDADMIYDPTASPALQLHDEGDEVRLLDASGNIVSTANAFVGPGWPAGDAAIHATMERTDPLGEDTASNWHTNIGITTYGTDADGQPLVATAHVVNSQSLEEWTLFATLQATSTTPGTTVDVPLDLTQAERRESGWPWIRVTRPVADVAGGGAAVETSSYTFGGHSIDGEYLFEIDTTGWTPGEHLVWIVYGEGEAVLVPITVLP